MLLLGASLFDGRGLADSEGPVIRAAWSETATRLTIVGSSREDWFLEFSGDLTNWRRDPALPPLAAGPEGSAPERAIPPTAPRTNTFLRAVRTDGLYDDTLVRTFRLTFPQADWDSLLIAAHGTTSRVTARLELDNGRVLEGVGARYRGYSSFNVGGAKKSINLDLDYLNSDNRLLGFDTLLLNNGFLDPTLVREAVYFGAFRRYAPAPRAALARVFINGLNRGVYSLVQAADGDLMREWFPTSTGDHWKTPSTRGSSALTWLGAGVDAYLGLYELESAANPTNAWNRLLAAIEVLNRMPATQNVDALEGSLAVDDWLWFLALENVFADEDSYWKKGSDYGFYFEPLGGRLHPLQHDGNESFNLGHIDLSPLEGANDPGRPVLRQLLSVPEWRQRYLAHVRTVLEESFNPAVLTPWIDRLAALSEPAILADPIRFMSEGEYRDGLDRLKAFVTERHVFLRGRPEVGATPPAIESVSSPAYPTAAAGVTIEARVSGGIPGRLVDSVWLHHRAGAAGRFQRVRMADDGRSADGDAGDGTYAATIPPSPAGSRVAYYVEAQAADPARTARFHPARAERGALEYLVRPAQGASSPVRINELVSDNASVVRDPQGEFEDYVELWNSSAVAVSLAGCYLSDDPAEPRKWRFPEETIVQAGGYLLVWLDGDEGDPLALHAGFKLDRDGEALLLVDRDDRFNALLDSVTFGPLGRNQAWGRPLARPDTFEALQPSPGTANP
jgi:hypothetical protein